MANTKSAIKAIRVAERRRQRNKPVRTALKTYVRKARGLVAEGEMEAARAGALLAATSLDKAAAKGIIHPNNAARRKSRLMRRLSRAAAPSAGQ